jgi:hypothetical protein
MVQRRDLHEVGPGGRDEVDGFHKNVGSVESVLRNSWARW